MDGQAIIQDLSHDGRGIAKIEGKVVFIEGALPQEEVEFSYIKQKKDYDEAKLISIKTTSPYRVDPKCPHFGVCGGCSLQHLSAEGQVRFKQDHWLQLMAKMGGGLPDKVLSPLQANTWHYRRKARFGVKYVAKKEKTLFGFREKHHPAYLIDMQDCPIIDKRFHEKMPLLADLLNALPSKAQIAQIELAAGEDLALVFRHLKPLSAEDKDLLWAFGEASGFRLYLQPKGPDSLELFYPKDVSFGMHFYLKSAQAYLKFEPLDFIQVNASLNEKMIDQALNLLDLQANDRVLDLFCGLGNFSLPLARQVQQVYGVEGSAGMMQRAQANADAQGFSNLQFYHADLMDSKSLGLLKELTFNKILIDPPRDGALTVVEAMAELNPERIVYVSCHPATLARDAAILRQKFGYRMVKGGIMDMFPHTSHIESIALFLKESDGKSQGSFNLLG
jgi:23S rRNA (uracil1939-C5)-methyltransferase